MQTLDIIIPTLNGRDLLAQCLPGVAACLDELDPPAGLIVVDDASTDGSSEFIGRAFPQVRVVELPQNSGFPRAINAGAAASDADLLLLLNNDMIPLGSVLAPLLEHFEDPDVAAVAARVVKWDRATIDVGRRLRTWERGEIGGVGNNDDHPGLSYTFFASGGAMLVRRDWFIGLGGFDEMYSPGYVEDTDFCFRTWKRGRKIAYDPRSTFVHMGSATFSRGSGGPRRLARLCRVRYLMRRNAFCFYWSCLTDPRARREYWRNLPGRACRAMLRGDLFYFAGMLGAAARLRLLRRRLRREQQAAQMSDPAVFEAIARLCASRESAAQPHAAHKLETAAILP